jgi:hypothetical protein
MASLWRLIFGDIAKSSDFATGYKALMRVGSPLVHQRLQQGMQIHPSPAILLPSKLQRKSLHHNHQACQQEEAALQWELLPSHLEPVHWLPYCIGFFIKTQFP